KTCRLEAEEQRDDDRHVAPGGVYVAQRHDGDNAGNDKEPAGDDAAERAVHQPADIGRKLLRLGARQQHAIVERMQEPLLRYPALLLDQNAVHDRDLAGGAAEAQACDAQPGQERLAPRDAVTELRTRLCNRELSQGVPRLLLSRRGSFQFAPYRRFFRKYSKRSLNTSLPRAIRCMSSLVAAPIPSMSVRMPATSVRPNLPSLSSMSWMMSAMSL